MQKLRSPNINVGASLLAKRPALTLHLSKQSRIWPNRHCHALL
ncbi:hypothetical protein HDC30_004558 [Pseudomonas sp. JAI115]|nr:hypothetical protein [Pseudomonas sp. JAI115]